MKIMLVLVCLVAVTACTKPTRVTQMTAPAVEVEKIASSPDLQGSMELGQVTGGKETNIVTISEVGPSGFRQALDQSLQVNGLLALNPAEADYRLDANLVELEKPFISFDAEVTSVINYTVYEKETDAVFFHKTITAPFIARYSSAWSGSTRLQMANEGSIKTNIRLFLQEFVAHWTRGQP